MTSFKEVLDKALQDPDARAEWDRLQLARDVSIWLLKYRIDHDLTQTELADILGWKQSVVARLEGGENEPSIATLHTLIERLGTTATIAIRPGQVQVHFSKPRALPRTNRRRVSEAAVDASSPPRQRRGPSIRRNGARRSPVAAA